MHDDVRGRQAAVVSDARVQAVDLSDRRIVAVSGGDGSSHQIRPDRVAIGAVPVDGAVDPDVGRFVGVARRLEPTVDADIGLPRLVGVRDVDHVVIGVGLGAHGDVDPVGAALVGIADVPQRVGSGTVVLHIDPAEAAVGRAIIDVRVAAFDDPFDQHALVGQAAGPMCRGLIVAENVMAHADQVIELRTAAGEERLGGLEIRLSARRLLLGVQSDRSAVRRIDDLVFARRQPARVRDVGLFVEDAGLGGILAVHLFEIAVVVAGMPRVAGVGLHLMAHLVRPAAPGARDVFQRTLADDRRVHVIASTARRRDRNRTRIGDSTIESTRARVFEIDDDAVHARPVDRRRRCCDGVVDERNDRRQRRRITAHVDIGRARLRHLKGAGGLVLEGDVAVRGVGAPQRGDIVEVRLRLRARESSAAGKVTEGDAQHDEIHRAGQRVCARRSRKERKREQERECEKLAHRGLRSEEAGASAVRLGYSS